MASSIEFVEYVNEQLSELGNITYKKMFGEYGFYYKGKFFAVICDNQFFVKITEEGRVIIESPELAPPYDGAKPYFLISDMEDREFLCKLTITTCEALPEPKPKKKGGIKNA